VGMLAGTAQSLLAADNTGTGGTITYTDSSGLNPVSSPPYIGGYVVHKFTSSGTYSNSYAVSADVLVVGCGGAGGNNGGGGGGAGGVIYSNNYTVDGGSNYTVTVGGGAVPKTYQAGWTQSSGSNSVFGTLTAIGGGGGGSRGDYSTPSVGLAGGSGGGGGSSPANGGSGTAGQGNSGGNGKNSSPYGGGGGGGAGGAGATSTNPGGNGGIGVAYSITGSSVYYGGGGGGGIAVAGTAGTGGSGIGGAGSQTTAGNGAANTGSGGGGGGGTCGSGGSGIVIVKYPYVVLELTVAVTTPANGQVVLAGSSLTATATVASGTSPYTVTFYTNYNGGAYGPAGVTNASPYTSSLGTLGLGTYGIYATVTDSDSPTPATATSATNTFTVITPPSSFFWTNSAALGAWGTAGNWTNDAGIVQAPGTAGQTNYSLYFNNAATYTATNNLDNGFLLNQLNFGGATATLAGSSLTLTNNGATLPLINQNSTAAISIGNDLILGMDTTFGGSGSGTVTMSGAMSGAGSLTKTGTGTLTIAGTNNTYSGATVLSNGTVALGGGGSTSITIQNPGFTDPGIPDYIYYDAMTPAQKSAIVWAGSGATTNYVYSVCTGGNTWKVPANSGPAVGIQMTGGIKQTFNFSPGTYTLGWKANGRNGNQVNPYYVTVDGVQVGGNHSWNSSGATWKTDSQVFTISTAGNHDIGLRGTAVTDLTVFLDDFTLAREIDFSATLPSNTVLSLAAPGTLDVYGVSQTVASLSDSGVGGGTVTNSAVSTATLTINPSSGSTTFSGTIRGPISLVKNGIGTQVLAGANAYTGSTVVSNGTLLVNGSITGSVSVVSGATLGGTGAITGNVTFASGALAIFTNGAPLTFTGPVTLNSNTVHLTLPDNLALGTYLLATNTTGGFAGSFAINPVIDSGSTVAAFATNITADASAVRLIVSSNPIIMLSPPSLPTGTRLSSYSQTLTASGGTEPYTNTVVEGSLPSGLTLSPEGELSGTPDTAGTYSFTVQAMDALGYTGTKAYSVTILSNASSFFWTNTVSSGWSVTGNWTNDVGGSLAPLAAGQTNYTLNFNAGTYTASNDLSTGFVLNRLNFGGATVTLAGYSLTLTNSGATLPQVNQNSAAAVTVSNNIVLATNATMGGTGGGTLTLAGALSGDGSLTKTTSGTLTLSGNNTYNGGTVINGGGQPMPTLVQTAARSPSPGQPN